MIANRSWFDRIWNPVGIRTGCDKECCQLASSRFSLARLDNAPPSRVLVGPADIFGSHVPDHVIRDLFMLMAYRPRLQFKVLVRNVFRMEQWFGSWPSHEAQSMLATADKDWPVPNVSIGCVVRDQDDVDHVIGSLLATSATQRFIVIERFEGQINLVDIECPAMVDTVTYVGGCTVCSGDREACRDGRYNPLVDGALTEVILCDRRLDNASALWHDDVIEQCQLHSVPTVDLL